MPSDADRAQDHAAHRQRGDRQDTLDRRAVATTLNFASGAGAASTCMGTSLAAFSLWGCSALRRNPFDNQRQETTMPQSTWSAKRERQYQHIKEGLKARGKSEDLSEEIAARTVNKERARHGESREASRS